MMGAPDDTTPQPKAHIGANQVIGFRSSIVADKVGTDGLEGAIKRSAMIGF